MARTRTFSIGVAFAAILGVAAAQAPQTPNFQVDPFWPKPLPNHWLFGSITGVTVDARNHVWVVHRGAGSLNARTEIGLASNPPTAEACCLPAPHVLQFDPAGNLVSHWGGPGQGYDWPQSPGAITVDAKGNVWIVASGPGDPQPGVRGRGAPSTGSSPGAQAPPPPDGHVLKFAPDGRFLLQIGKPGKADGSNSTTGLHRPTAVDVDIAAGEVFVADGIVNRRIAVFDSETGAYKRHWGAYGTKPDDTSTGAYDPAGPPAKQFRVAACVKLSKDALVYMCDRRNDRIQVFRKDGTFVKEGFVAKATLGEGSVWSLAFSSDPQQRFLYVADGSNQKVWIVDRQTLETVSSVGAGGRGPGQFYGVGSVAVDSTGNLYTGETYEGKRLQKFNFKGMGRPAAKEQP